MTTTTVAVMVTRVNGAGEGRRGGGRGVFHCWGDSLSHSGPARAQGGLHFASGFRLLGRSGLCGSATGT